MHYSKWTLTLYQFTLWNNTDIKIDINRLIEGWYEQLEIDIWEQIDGDEHRLTDMNSLKLIQNFEQT